MIKGKSDIQIKTYTDPDELPEPQDLKSNSLCEEQICDTKDLIIVDDSMKLAQDKIQKLYIYFRPEFLLYIYLKIILN